MDLTGNAEVVSQFLLQFFAARIAFKRPRADLEGLAITRDR